jgi:transposase-like protein
MSPNEQLHSARGATMYENARLTPKGREVLVQRLQAGQRVAEVARAMRLPGTTVREWWHRFQGGDGLQDRICRPHHSPRAIAVDRRGQIEALRRQRGTGRLIARDLGVLAATVSRVLRQAGLSRCCELELQPPVLRYERPAPGELVHIDAKKLGRIERASHRVTATHPDGTARVGLCRDRPDIPPATERSPGLAAPLQLPPPAPCARRPAAHQPTAAGAKQPIEAPQLAAGAFADRVDRERSRVRSGFGRREDAGQSAVSDEAPIASAFLGCSIGADPAVRGACALTVERD